MVTIEFAKNAKTLEAIQDVYDRDQAQEIAEKNKTAAFSAFAKLARAFSKAGGEIILTGYRKRYEPFWHIVGESFFEYDRRTTYQIPVRPEVQSVTVNDIPIKVQPDSLMCVFDAVDHCFEHYKKEIVQDALKEKGKDYTKYLDAKAKPIKGVEELQRRDADVVPVHVRASFILTNLYKEVLKPIQADEIVEQKVVIGRLTLYFSPIHVFEFKEETGDRRGTIEVDGVTGAWVRGTHLISDLAKKYWSADTAFDIGTEVAAAIIPGAGVGMIVAKKLFEKRKEGKMERQHKELHHLYQSRRRK